MIFKNKFDNLDKDQIDLLNSYFDGYDYNSSSYTYLANYMWRDTHNITWEVIGDYLCIGAMSENEEGGPMYCMSVPLTKDGGYNPIKLKETIEVCRDMFKDKGQPMCMGLVPETIAPVLKEAYGDEVELEESRDDADYIYLKDDLVNLSGRKYHQKKNHLNYFLRNTEFTYEEATPEMVPEIMEYILGKNEYKLGETPEEWKEILEMENIAIGEMLSFVGKGLLSGIIRIEGKIVAVTFGEFAKTNSKEKVLVHVEKADDRIRGLYQAINNEFCKRLPEETVYINREEDMGLENLRQTKLSYRPISLSMKYRVVFK